MAGLPDGFTMLPEEHGPIQHSGVTIAAGNTINVLPTTSPGGVSFATADATTPMPQSVPRPSTAANPASPPGTMPTGRAGQPSTESMDPMDTDGIPEEQPDDTMGASAQSISSGSRTSTSLAGTIVFDIQSLMWEAIVSRQCAPMILDLLLATEYVPQDDDKGNRDHIKDMTFISNTATIQRDTFIPAAMNNLNIHLWFTWLTEAQYNDFKAGGTVPGYKDTRGDT
eukprot:4638465-Amphidinium_carterae.1